jgi:hypothetical protein
MNRRAGFNTLAVRSEQTGERRAHDRAGGSQENIVVPANPKTSNPG